MPAVADRVKETTTTTGTGDITLAGAVSNYVDFNTAIGVGIPCLYSVAHQSAAEFENGVGYLSGSTTLVRETVSTSTNSNALVSFSSGTKDVFISILTVSYMDAGQIYAMSIGAAMP